MIANRVGPVCVALFAILCCLCLVGTASAKGEGYLKEQQKDDGPVTAKGRVDMQEDGNDYVFTVHIWTHVKGKGKTGRGNAFFFMFGEGDKVISVMEANKYCSTGLKNDDEKHDQTQKKYRKAYYDANVVSEMLLVIPEFKGGVPQNKDELVRWSKEVVGPELRKIRDELAKGKTKEGQGYFIRRVK